MTDDLAERLIRRAEELKSARGVWEEHWQEVADHVLPRRSSFVTRRPRGDKRGRMLLDTTAVQGNKMLAAALHGTLTSPSSPWFQLRARDPALNDDDGLRRWLDEAGAALLAAFSSVSANFTPQVHELYLDIAALGTGVLFVGERPTGGLAFQTRHLGECYIAEDVTGRVDTVYRRFRLTARQAAQQWDAKVLSRVLREAADRRPDAEFEFLHVVEPRRERDPTRQDGRNKPFRSVHVEVEGGRVLAESGFDSFPFMVPRWSKLSGEVYGRSPGMDALPEAKMLNAIWRTTLQGAEKIVNPPLQVPDDGFVLPIRTAPGALLYRRPGAERIEPLVTGAQPNISLDLIQRLQEHVRDTFHIPQLQFADRPSMSATEALIQDEDRMRALSPMVARLQVEFLGPCIERAFAIASRQGLLPTPPDGIVPGDLKIEYVSPIARAQRSIEARAIERLLQFATAATALAPDLPRLFDAEAALRHVAEVTGAPHAVLRAAGEAPPPPNPEANADPMSALAGMLGATGSPEGAAP